MKYIILFILLLSTGFDILAISTPVGTVRLSFFLFFFTLILIFLTKGFILSSLELLFLIPLVMVMLFSVYYSSDGIRSLSYIIWFVTCYFLYFNVIKNLVIDLDSNFILRVFRDLGRFQILACIVLKVLGVDRPALLFYEPSYMILALLPYIYFSIMQFQYKTNIYKKIDLFLVFSLILVTMSANLLLAIIFVVVVGYFRLSFKYFFYITVLAIFSYYFSFWYYQHNADLLAFTFKNLHESPNFIKTVLERTGNRWPRMIIGIDVIKDFFPSGIGLGTFSDFSINYNINKDYAAGLPWNEPRGFPASNVFVELLAEGGLMVFISFLFFISLLMFMPIKASVQVSFVSHWRKVIFIFLLLLLFESSLLRPYFWAYLGILSSFLTMPSKTNSERVC
jgi:hypothetical protein